MFRVSRIILLLAVIAAVWFFWPFGKYEDTAPVVEPQASSDNGPLFTKPLPENAASPQGNPAPDDASQEVAAATPDGTAQRAPQEPLLQPKRFYRVVVQDGGSLKAGDTTITLAEIEVEGLTGQCEDSRGQAWPCGRAARHALRRLIRGRAVMCHVPASGAADSLAAWCSVGDRDLSFWMVAQGWAKPKQPAHAAFKEAAEAARERRLGIWR